MQQEHIYPKHQILSLQNIHTVKQNSQFKTDIEALCPYVKTDFKFTDEEQRIDIPTIAMERNCDLVAFFETQHHESLFFSLAQITGPTVKFEVFEIRTKESVSFEGNFFNKTRSLVEFDSSFDSSVPLRVMKEMLKRQFSAPFQYCKTAPFVDHLVQFTVVDADVCGIEMHVFNSKMQECGPSCGLVPVGIYQGCLQGELLWRNKNYQNYSQRKQEAKEEVLMKIKRREYKREISMNTDRQPLKDEIDDFFTQGGWNAAFE